MSGSVWNPVGWINTAFAEFINFVQAVTNAVTRTVQSKLEEHISIKDFGAICDGTTDDTIAVQKALTYATTVPGGVTPIIEIPGFTRVTLDTLNIDRPVGQGAELRIVGTGKLAGFYSVQGDTGNFFTSSLPHTTTPVSEKITFENLQFEAQDTADGVRALDGNKFLRVKFEQCYFKRVKLATTSTYLQTYHLHMCQAEQWNDWFADAKGLYDIKTNQSIFENAPAGKGFSCFDPASLTGAAGCSWTNNLFEGNLGPFLSLKTPYGVTVSGNYFEYNTEPNLDFSQGRTQGVVVSGNSFFLTPANKADTNFYDVRIGECYGFTGTGNYCDGRLYDFQNAIAVAFIGAGESPSANLFRGTPSHVFGGVANGNATWINFPSTAVPSTDPNTLDDYKEGTFTPVVEGLTTAGVGTYTAQVGTYTKIGNRVMFNLFVNWTAHTGTGNMVITGLPYVAKNTPNAYNAVTNRPGNLTLPANTILVTTINPNESRIIFESTPTGGGAAAGLAIDTAANIMISGQYSV